MFRMYPWDVRPSKSGLGVFSHDTYWHQVRQMREQRWAFSLHKRPHVLGSISWADVSVCNSHGKSFMTNLGQGCLQDSTRWGIAGVGHLRFPPTPTGATWVQAQGSRHGQSPSTSRPVTRRHNGTIAEKRGCRGKRRSDTDFCFTCRGSRQTNCCVAAKLFDFQALAASVFETVPFAAVFLSPIGFCR